MARRTTAEWRAVVFKHPNVGDVCKVFLLYLADHMRADGKVSVPRALIAADLGIAERRVDDRFAKARQHGLLDRVSAGSKGHTAVYARTFPSGLLPLDSALSTSALSGGITTAEQRAKLTQPRQITTAEPRTTTTEPGTSSHPDSSISDRPEGPSSPQATTSPGERATPPAAADDEDQSSKQQPPKAPHQGEPEERRTPWQEYQALTTDETASFQTYCGARSIGAVAKSLDRQGELGQKLKEWRASQVPQDPRQRSTNTWDKPYTCIACSGINGSHEPYCNGVRYCTQCAAQFLGRKTDHEPGCLTQRSDYREGLYRPPPKWCKSCRADLLHDQQHRDDCPSQDTWSAA